MHTHTHMQDTHAHLAHLWYHHHLTVKHRETEGQIHKLDDGTDGNLVLSAQRSEEKVPTEDSQAGNWFTPCTPVSSFLLTLPCSAVHSGNFLGFRAS